MRVAVITGGASGLGLATALAFARDGMQVVVGDIDGVKAKSAVAGFPGNGHQGLDLDVADERSVAALFEAVESVHGPVSVLAHFAGTLGAGGSASGIGLAESDVSDWDRVFAVNARGTFLCVREMARRREKAPVEHGRIITVSSLAGQMGGLQSGLAYSASKAAVLGITRAAARELGPLGITVNAISPGPIDTPMLAKATGSSGQSAKYTKLDAIPLGRVGLPDEIAAAACFLASIGGGYVTGATIDVNGGLFIH